MAQVQVDITELIRFYDESREAGDHSNAIKAVAGEELCLELAAQHLRNEHHLRVDVSRPCTPGS